MSIAAPTPHETGRVSLLRRTGDMCVSGMATFLLTTMGWLLFWTAAPAVFDWKTVAIVSGSMQPRLGVGDAVVVKPGTDGVAPGRLISFRDPAQPHRVLTHRVIASNPDGTWKTQGDANPSPDSTPVPTENILGTARLVIPYAGFPAYWLSAGEWLPLGGTVGLAVLATLALFFTGRSGDHGADLAGPAAAQPATPLPAQPATSASAAPPSDDVRPPTASAPIPGQTSASPDGDSAAARPGAAVSDGAAVTVEKPVGGAGAVVSVPVPENELHTAESNEASDTPAAPRSGADVEAMIATQPEPVLVLDGGREDLR